MPAEPKLNARFRQEWYQGQAEDVFEVTSLKAAVKVPYGSFADALQTAERTDLEPKVVDAKYYLTGIGTIAERSTSGPKELLNFVEVLE